MRRIALLALYAILCAIAACTAPKKSEERVVVPAAPILIVTAGNMNARSELNELNKLMAADVSNFTLRLKAGLESDGKDVTLRAYEYASETDIAAAIALMARRPGLLIQVYWTVKPDRSMVIVADAMKVQFRDAGRAAYFPTRDRREYLSIGLSAKPRDTPENHAIDYRRLMREIYP